MLSVEDLNEHLSKASALMQIALHYDFSELPAKTIHDYLWALSDNIQNAYTSSTDLLQTVFAACKTVNIVLASQSNSKEMTS